MSFQRQQDYYIRPLKLLSKLPQYLKLDVNMGNNFRNAIILMRIPFSVFLMPVYWFALSSFGGGPIIKSILVFSVLHLFAYPASNGFNSMYDKDTDSIGGIKNPPPVNSYLKWLVLTFDLVAIFLSFFISITFAAMIFIYLMISKAYSYDKIRLKKYPIISALVVSFFQGAFIFFAICIAFNVALNQYLFPAIVSSMFLLGSYPLTQIYQHDSDAKRGDKTLSILLGIKGTFIFSAVVFAIASAMLIFYFFKINEIKSIVVFGSLMLPVLFIFNSWMLKVFKNDKFADFENTMRLNKVSSLCLSVAFILILILK